MGMESFHILLLPQEVSIVTEQGCWRLEGKSGAPQDVFEEKLERMGAVKRGEAEWELEHCVEMRIWQCGGFCQGLEMRGCLACIRQASDLCYEVIKSLEEGRDALRVYILNEETKADSAEALYEHICGRYHDKIAQFCRCFPNISFKVTCGEFYREIKRRESWFYKIYLWFSEKCAGGFLKEISQRVLGRIAP